MSVCLDAYALLAWLRNEEGAAEVDALLMQAATNDEFRCLVSAINLAEVYYRLWRIRGSVQAEAFWEDAWRGEIPVAIIEPSRRRLLQAARLKARYPVALADAFAVQVAQEHEVPLVTGDPEIKAMASEERLSLMWIGIKRSGSLNESTR